MANTLKPKRSSVAGNIPTTTNLSSGEMGVNMADQKVWINNGTSVVQIGSGKLSGLADVVLSSLATGQGLSWNGTNWVNSSAGSGTVTSVSGTGTVSGLTLTGSVTGSGSLTLGGTLSLTSGQVTTALGFTPYNATNPSGYITGSGNAATATALQTARTIGGVSFNGTANINLPGVNAAGNQNTTGTAAGLTDNSAWMLNRGSVAAASVDTATANGFYTQTNVGDSQGLLVFNAGGSLGPLQMTFTYGGLMQFRGKTDSTTWTPWKTVVTSANVSTYALPISGGTLTGAYLDFSNSSPSLRITSGPGTFFIGDDDIVNLASGALVATPSSRATSGVAILSTFAYGVSQGDNKTHFGYNTGSSYVNYIRGAATYFDSGTVQIAGSQVLHAGNFSSYAPSLSSTYADPAWITSIASSKLTGTIDNARLNGGTYTINVTGNAGTATTLQTARTINGVSFNGSANITVADSTKLPLSGGTLSGGLVINSGSTNQLQLNTSTGTQSLWIRAGYDSDGSATPAVSAFNVQFQSSGSSGGTFSFVSGNTKVLAIGGSAVNSLVPLQQSGNQVLHAGNYSTYSPSYGYFDDYQRGAYRVIADHGSQNTWYIRSNGRFTWARAHDWSQSFDLDLGSGTTNSNDGWARFGQQTSNSTAGTWRGTQFVQYTGGTSIDGFVRAGRYYLGDDSNYMLNAGDGSLRVQTVNGYIDIGPKNSSWCHIYSDRDFYTNRGIWINGSRVLDAGNYTSYSPSLTGSGASGTWGISVTGSAATLTTGRTIAMTGDVTWASASFNGSTNVTGTATLAASGVTAGTYTNATVTVDSKGRITSASSGTGGGVSSFNTRTGAVTLSSGDVTAALGFTPYNSTNPSGYITSSGSITGAARSLDSSNYISRTGSSGNLNTDFSNTPAGTQRYQGDDSNLTNSPGGTWWIYENKRHSNGTNVWGTQVAWGWEDNSNRLMQRNVSGNSWSGWVEYLNTGGRTFSGNLTMSGNISGNSDERLKTNWREMPENFVARLAKVRVGIYDRLDEDGVTQVGVSAQSFQELLPQAIMTAKDELGTLAVSYGNAALASAVELAKDNVDLRARVVKLEALVSKLIEG